MVSLIRHIPYIAHIHLDVDPSGPFGFLLGSYKKIFLKRVLKHAQKVICLSEVQRKFIAKKYDLSEDKITVIPNGVSKKFFQNTQKVEHNPLRALFVGRLVPQKNLPLLIDAISLMKEPIELSIAGEGEDKEKIVNLINKHKLKNVNLLGTKTQNELMSLYARHDIFILPSEKEGFSLAMLEAMASGLPIIASDVIGMNDFIDNCGILVKEPSADNYAKVLDNLSKDKSQINKMGKNAYEKAKLFSWEAVVDQLEIKYKEVVNENYK